jgi:AcrR family transcriptional regulator
MLSTGHRSNPGVEETRTRILTAARELFELHGTRGTTTREVAERAGVNEATLFRHFGSKHALLDAMREAAHDFDRFRSVLASLPGDDVAADLRTVAAYSVESMLSRRAMMCISLAESAARTDDVPEWRAPTQLLSDFTAYFTMQIERGRLKGDPDLLARYFMGSLFSYVIARKLWRDPAPDSAILSKIVDLFLNGASG